MVYGTNLRLPADYHDSTCNVRNLDSDYEYVNRLRQIIQRYKSIPIRHNNNSTSLFVHPDLVKCEYVFIRNDAIHKPLQPTYDGPFRVLKRGNKVYEIQLPGRKTNISIDRLKPAYYISDSDVILDANTDVPIRNSPVPYTTRSGRTSKLPAKYRH